MTALRWMGPASLLALTVLVSIGCTPEKAVDSPAKTAAGSSDRYHFVPEPPAPPRLQFLTSFSDARPWTRKAQTSFSQWVVGTDEKAGANTTFSSPYGIAARDGRIYICDVSLNCVHVIDTASNTYARLEAGDRIVNPVNLTIDDDGTRYLADTGAGQVLVFDAGDRFVRTIGNRDQWSPTDVAVRGDELYVTDMIGGKVEVVSKDGRFLRTISSKGAGPDQLTQPTNLAFGPDGRLYVTDTFLQIVKVFDPQGRFLATVGQPGANIGSFARPKGIAIDDQGTIYVADSQWDVVQIFNTQGQLLLVFGKPGEEPWAMGLPAGLAIDRTSISAFQKYLSPHFQAEYLLFVVNQFGKHKIAVYAYGRSTDLSAKEYQINMEQVEKRREELRSQSGTPANGPTKP